MRLPVSRGTTSGVDDGVIPMINIVFLLLVFFMLAGTIRPTDPIDTEPPVSLRDARTSSAPHVLHLGPDGTLAYDGETLSLADLSGRLALLMPPSKASDVGTDDQQALGDEHDVLFALRADADVPFAILRQTVDALRAAGVQRVELITEPVVAVTP